MTPRHLTMEVVQSKLASLATGNLERTTTDKVDMFSWTLPDSRVYIRSLGEDWAREFHTHKEERRLRSIVADPSMYLLEYSDIDAVKQVIRLLADDPDILVDNGFGVALPGPYFLRLMAREPAWDWRVDGRQDLPDWEPLKDV